MPSHPDDVSTPTFLIFQFLEPPGHSRPGLTWAGKPRVRGMCGTRSAPNARNARNVRSSRDERNARSARKARETRFRRPEQRAGPSKIHTAVSKLDSQTMINLKIKKGSSIWAASWTVSFCTLELIVPAVTLKIFLWLLACGLWLLLVAVAVAVARDLWLNKKLWFVACSYGRGQTQTVKARLSLLSIRINSNSNNL